MSEQVVKVISFSKDRRTAEITVINVDLHGGACARPKAYPRARKISITLHVERVNGNTYRSHKVDSEGNPWTYTLIL